jgi:hypothetical protein
MDWAREKRLELIAALALHHMRHAPLGESWHGLMQRVLYLATWPDDMLEFNKKNFADAIELLGLDETD